MFYDKRHSPEVQEWCYHLMAEYEMFKKYKARTAISKMTDVADAA
jgi:hypothetical protein